MLQLFSRHQFEQAVREHKAERNARGFTCWGQFVAMLFLPSGRGAVAARDLWLRGRQRRQAAASGLAERARALHPGLCQRALSMAVVPQHLPPSARPLPWSQKTASMKAAIARAALRARNHRGLRPLSLSTKIPHFSALEYPQVRAGWCGAGGCGGGRSPEPHPPARWQAGYPPSLPGGFAATTPAFFLSLSR